MLKRRHPRQAERALANVDLYLEMSKAYSVRGLRAFAEAMTSSWNEARTEGGKAIEGRVDIQEEAVCVYTMHASKGLEWPVVVPINTMGPPKAINPEIVDRAAGRIYVSLFGICPDGYDDAHAAEKAEVERERVRLWYVTATRARELLVLPRPSVPIARNAWGAIVDLALDTLPALDLPPSEEKAEFAPRPEINSQTREEFAKEAATIADAHRRLKWIAPSRDEGPVSGAREDVSPLVMPSDIEDSEIDDLPTAVQGGRNRGLVIHKLFEEALNGETDDATAALTSRAADLIAELGEPPSDDPAKGLSPTEIAACVSKTLALPEIAALAPDADARDARLRVGDDRRRGGRHVRRRGRDGLRRVRQAQRHRRLEERRRPGPRCRHRLPRTGAGVFGGDRSLGRAYRLRHVRKDRSCFALRPLINRQTPDLRMLEGSSISLRNN